MAVTILLLAWAALVSSGFEPDSAKRVVLLSLSLVGLILSLVGFGLALRAGKFVHHYATFGRSVEEQQLAVTGPFRSALAYRGGITGPAKLTASRFVLPLVPALFAVLCVILAYYSLAARSTTDAVPIAAPRHDWR